MRVQCDELDAQFRRFLRADVPLIDRIFEHLVDGGGKRFRPLLVLLISALGPRQDPERVFRLAVSVEFIHTATLLHDDVVDQSDLRRGNRVAYRVWGAEPSVLSGDYLYSRAFNLLVELGDLAILDAVSSATTAMARGEVLQLLRSYSPATSREEYLDVIRGKTASLIAASCTSAGRLAALDEGGLQALGRFGMDLGLAFQVVDDVLDYTAERGELGKAIGKDFLEGKVTLPVIVLMERLDPERRAEVAEVFLKEHPEERDFSRVLALMGETGSLEESMAVARAHGGRAAAELAALPPGPHRDSLGALCDYVVGRRS